MSNTDSTNWPLHVQMFVGIQMQLLWSVKNNLHTLFASIIKPIITNVRN